MAKIIMKNVEIQDGERAMSERNGQHHYFPELELFAEVLIPAHSAIRSGYSNRAECSSVVGRVVSINVTRSGERIGAVQCNSCSYSVSCVLEAGVAAPVEE